MQNNITDEKNKTLEDKNKLLTETCKYLKNELVLLEKTNINMINIINELFEQNKKITDNITELIRQNNMNSNKIEFSLKKINDLDKRNTINTVELYCFNNNCYRQLDNYDITITVTNSNLYINDSSSPFCIYKKYDNEHSLNNLNNFNLLPNLDIKKIIISCSENECILLDNVLTKLRNITIDQIIISEITTEYVNILCGYTNYKNVQIAKTYYFHYASLKNHFSLNNIEFSYM